MNDTLAKKLIYQVNELGKAVGFLAIIIIIVSFGSCLNADCNTTKTNTEMNKITTQLENISRRMPDQSNEGGICVQ